MVCPKSRRETWKRRKQSWANRCKKKNGPPNACWKKSFVRRVQTWSFSKPLTIYLALLLASHLVKCPIEPATHTELLHNGRCHEKKRNLGYRLDIPPLHTGKWDIFSFQTLSGNSTIQTQLVSSTKPQLVSSTQPQLVPSVPSAKHQIVPSTQSQLVTLNTTSTGIIINYTTSIRGGQY